MKKWVSLYYEKTRGPLGCDSANKNEAVVSHLCNDGHEFRVARWYIFKPEIPIWVNFGGPWNGKGLYSLWPFGIYYGH
jgi:hypothetical protein